MGHIEGALRPPHILFPEALDAFVAEENPARFIDALVDSLDLDARGFRHTQPAATARPSYAPGALLKLYLYGYMNRSRSSRRLEKETHRNVELLWLLRTLHPDFKTIAAFRNDKAKGFKQVFRAFALLCKEWGLFGPEGVAIDGTKRKAVKSLRRNLTPAKRGETLKRLDTHIAHYVHDLDAADAQETERQPPTAAHLRENIRPLRERKGRSEGLRREMERTGQSQVALTDPDSRAMPKSPKVDGGYKAQVAVDATHQLFVVQEVSHAVTDVDRRSGIAIQAEAALAVDQITVVAAMGYSPGEESNACEEAGIEPDVAKPLTSATRK